MQDLIIDFSAPRERANFVRMVGALDGKYRVVLKRHRKQRSNPQNAYYFGVVLEKFIEFRHDQGEEFDTEMAHEMFAMKFLRRSVVDLRSGEIIGQTRLSTASLNTVEFSEYVEKVIVWLADYGIPVPPPDQDYREARRAAMANQT